jgi:hypothetical protein
MGSANCVNLRAHPTPLVPFELKDALEDVELLSHVKEILEVGGKSVVLATLSTMIPSRRGRLIAGQARVGSVANHRSLGLLGEVVRLASYITR